NMSWSPPSAFKVGPVPTRILSPPLTQMVENLFLIPTKIHGIAAETIHSLRTRGAQKYIEKFPRIMWSPIAGADRYLIEISKNKSFSEILVSQTVPRTYYNWKYIEPGTYYWRAKGLSENSKDGLYSQTQELKIAVQAPAALSKSSIIDEVPDQILLQAPPPPITISWNPTIFSKAYEIEFSNSSEFKNPTHFITNSSSKQIQLATAGIYFWRIRSLDGNKMPVSPFSSTYTLEFQRVFKDPLQNKNLLAIYPKQQDSIILVGRSQSEIQFKWTKPYVDAEYRIELSYEPNFESVFYSASTKENHLTYTEMFHGGVVYWRIRAEKKDFVTDWTGANRFLVSYENRPFDFEKSDLFFAARLRAKERQLAMLAAQKRRIAQLRTPAGALELQLDTPQLIEPPTSFLIESNIDPTLNAQKLANLPSDKMYTLVKGYPVIRWKKVPAAERYVIEIAKDKDFTQTVTKSPTWNPFYSWDAARPGQFYYRIQAFNDRYKRSQFTDAYPLQVTVAAVTPTSQDTFVEVYDEPRDMWQPPEPFTLSWKPVVFARGYEVEFSEDNTFSLAKVYKTNETSTDIRVNRAGLYYWRVRPINEHLVGIAPFSTIRSVEVIQTNRRPASLENITGLFPIKRTMLFVGEGIMNLAFHWISPEPNTSVELEVSDTKNFERVLSRKISKKGAAVISNDLPEGHLYWRVKSKSTVSAVNEFYLRRERKPYTPEVKADLSH
ncbi:MAG: hypothetical protein KDD38_07525, partial [Bdellovibrionales bacterium]|nr:hypothetical protein [Bdellovibrionales bacterium]